MLGPSYLSHQEMIYEPSPRDGISYINRLRQPTHFTYLPKDKFHDVSAKPRLFERPNDDHLGPLAFKKNNSEGVTTKPTLRYSMLASEWRDTMQLRDKQDWLDSRYNPDHWFMFENYDPRHPSYYDRDHLRDGYVSYYSPRGSSISSRSRISSNDSVASAPHFITPKLTSRTDMLRRSVTSARSIGQRYNHTPRWSNHYYGASTGRF
eukprot:TCONS_00004578-protein